ncbi:MAG: hypothetical protein EAX87_11000 [Candidatus Thorarchaeota archaeon]|nr:hypothetical protein [Candidatus Thorarchaeota archaeon]
MTPTDDDVTPPPDDMPEDVEDVEDEIEREPEPHRRRGHTRRRRSKLREYSSMGSFIAWMAFLVVWLFFFAGSYGLFENIAVVLIALLVVFAANAVLWIPLDQGWKARSSAISAFIWFAFLILWIFFFAADFGIYENIGIGIASLLIIGAVNVVLWVPSAGEGRGSRVSALGGIGWLTFMVLWLPFANDFALIYPINGYQNMAIILASFLLMLLVVTFPWRSEISIGIDATPGVSIRAKGSLAGFLLYLVFLVIWMWAFASGFSANQNVATILVSFAIFAAIMVGAWLPWSRRRGEGPENWWAIGLAFVWVIALSIWFWFFADSFNAYQNFAVFLVSLMAIVAISGGAQWKKIRDFESLDWDD